MNKLFSRRSFLQKASLAGVAVGFPREILATAAANRQGEKKKHLVFLFQGDSITDGNRGRTNDPNHIMGHGYAFSIASRTGAYFPEQQLSFINRGISGNKVTDL